ncbi:hypothetical protein [Pedobacter frigidisoli]|uniref:hypothetical protein n=1 Tax=Pedobacter frigidisoli TaxID=2530455 RepID=UPI00293029BF|nr:hypothetical protein [Pedobacter frigidisoli]
MDHHDSEVLNFKEAFCPFGYLDINMAVIQALAAGFDGAWAFDQVEIFCDECGAKMKDVDPCFIVMDSIFQHARNEIDEISGFDICNDADFFVYGNFMCSSFEGTDEDKEKLMGLLSGLMNLWDSLSVCAKYWLGQTGIELKGMR